MYTTLQVVNECLATMGEAPLNTLAEPHEFKASAQRILSKADKHIQSRGWWYNSEEQMLSPDPINSHITLPGDCLRVESGVRSLSNLVRGAQLGYLVQRGSRLYNTLTGSYEITETVAVHMVRQVPFTELPVIIADYVAAEAVLKFQSNYDGDSKRTAELTQAYLVARAEAMAEDIRQRRVNFRDNNPTLSRIKSAVRSARYNLGR